ncbi:MAG: phosphate acyltransferase [Gemmatimonadota bacterium]|nr:phosphate acyltransferase [Gemmatimonadota bacterium]
MSDGTFLDRVRSAAREARRTLVFPEGEEPRVQQAVAEGVREGLFDAVLIGPPDEVADGLRHAGIDPGRAEIRDPGDGVRLERYRSVFTEIRNAVGKPARRAEELVRDPLLQGALMVHTGEAAASVAGSVRTTGDVVVAALRGVGTAEGIDTVSSSFYMAFGEDHSHGPSVLTFTDAAVVPSPTSAQLAEIGVAAARARRKVVGDEPRVAFLSYSTKGSASGPAVDLVRDAVARFRELQPDVAADGELQGDAALSEAVGSRKAPGSSVAGRANVLVFPDLDAANIAYKLVQYLGGAQAIGPILQGLSRPCNDLSRGATPSDILAVSCVTSLLAG